MTLIYLDNAATSWPKPPEVSEAMCAFLDRVGANPGRAAHRLAHQAGRVVDGTREALGELFGAPSPLHIALGMNATEAINLALCGILRPGDHVITSSMEHNAVMRPMRALEADGLKVSVIPCTSEGVLDPADVESSIRPDTVMIALNHASNVVGTLLPVAEVGHIARAHGLLMLVDAATTAGVIPIDVEADCIDLLAFTGHKCLYGPTGTGGLVIGARIDPARMAPLKRGGTGSRSEREDQPMFLPDAYESGTLNTVGLAGLSAALRWIRERGLDVIRSHQVALVQHLIDGLRSIPGLTVHGTLNAELQVASVSFNIAGMSTSEVGLRLDEEHDVMCRVGLHCSPAAHRTIDSFPNGTVRFAPGAFTTKEEIDVALSAVEGLARKVP